MIPKALVAIEIRHVVGIDPALLSATDRPYLIARVGGRFFGRSRLIPKTSHSFDLSKEPSHWVNEVAADGSDIPITVEIWNDRGDDAPARLLEIGGSVPIPYLSLDTKIGSGATQVDIRVKGRIVPNPVPGAPVPRVAKGSSSRATLRPPTDLIVELVEVGGLHAPVATGKAGLTRSEHRAGYTSDDHLGRVFVNHDLAKNWKSGTQQIQLEARIHGPVPPDTKVHWRLVDVDDPSNDLTGVHRQWGPYLDAGDYNHAGTPTGASGHDNEGKPAHDPPWAEVSGFSLSGNAKTEAKTAVVGAESKVILNCPSTAGDNFIVTADVESKTHIQSFGARTGIMTMWHRIQLESVRMTSGFALPTDELPVPFEAACVEMEPIADRVVPDQQYVAPDDDHVTDASTAYINSVFTHKTDPGWFALVAAMEPYPLPAKKGELTFEGPVTLQTGGAGDRHFEYFDLPGDHPQADFAQIKAGTLSIGFKLFSIQALTTPSGPMTRCWIEEHDAQPDFTHGDGSEAHAYLSSYDYSPRFRKHSGAVRPGGYGFPADVTVKVFNPGAFYVGGISPSVVTGGKKYFAGRTMIFTHHRVYRDQTTGLPSPSFHFLGLMVIVHELTHAFGMPHKCGYFDFRTPRRTTCCMNYQPNWMVDEARNLIPGTDRKVGIDLCGRHIKEVRRVRLQDNPGLNWK